MDAGPPIEEQQMRGLVLGGAEDQEIADFLGWTAAQLREKFGPLLARLRAQRHMSLRQKQTAIAAKGNTAMLVFLGKHELGQSDRAGESDDWPEPPQLEPKVG